MQALNRAQRRAKVKPTKIDPKHSVRHTTATFVLLSDCQPYAPGELTQDLLKVRAAYDRLVDGTADMDDFNRLAVALNIAKVRAAEISQDIYDGIEQGHQAMKRCKARYEKHGKFGFDGPGLQAMPYAIEAHEAIYQASSQRQMEIALKVVHAALCKELDSAVPVFYEPIKSAVGTQACR